MSADREARAMEKKRIKEEMRKEKELNHSLIPMSKYTQNDTGVVGIQNQDSVFYLGRWKYLKIYKLKRSDAGDEKKESLVKVLSSITRLRVRISSFRRLQGNSKMLFLSVYVMAAGYADAKSQFEEFEREATDMIARALSLPWTTISINDAVMMAQLNSTGQMKKFDFANLQGKDNLKYFLFPKIETQPDGFLYLPEVEKYVYTFMGTQFPTSLEKPYHGILDMPCSLYCAIDLQVMNEEENELFNLSLEQKYNCKFADEKKRNINLTYMVGMVSDCNVDRKELQQKMLASFNKEKVILCPCAGDEEKVYQSICSLGMVDYHAMRNSDADVIYKLVL